MPSLLRTNKELEQIYERQIDTVYRVCFMFLRSNKAEIEDAIQNTFLQLMRTQKLFDSLEHEKAWLIVTASNICRNVLSSSWKKRVMVTDSVDASRQNSFAIDETLMCVLELPDKYKTALYMFYYEGYSAHEIAKSMDKSETSVWGYLHKGRKLLKDKLMEGER